MLFRQDTLEAIVRGRVDLAFRRWASPRVRVGTRLHTAAGLIEVTELAEVRADGIGEGDARRAGFGAVAGLMAMLGNYPDRPIFRIGLRHAGADPRIALREDADVSDAALAAILARLARMDAASDGPWTHATLRLIARRPATLAARLAADLGIEPARFKPRVRRLKALGLTESLEVGYRLSLRGEALLRNCDRGLPATSHLESPGK
jgi:hypothetical protein